MDPLTQGKRATAAGARDIKKGRSLLCERSRIKYGFIRAQQKTYPVTVLCRVMAVSTSAYYAWLKSPQDSHNYQQDRKLVEKTRQIFIDNKQCFGSRRLADRLQKQGFAVGRFKTRRIMRDLKLQVRYPKRFKVTTDSNHNESISPNRLDRQFQVAKPNQVWTTDITYVWTLQGWLYVAVVIDLFSRQVVGWAIDDHMRTSLCVKALQMAFWRRKPPPGLLHHSDRGSQYASREYRQHLAVMKMEQSMSRKGNCWDNGVPRRRIEGVTPSCSYAA
ncbi:MAG: IS3 family transposase [Methylobacter sp.]